MNRETAFHSSDTLVVVDGSRRKRMLIIGVAVVAVIAAFIAFIMLTRGGTEEPATPAGGQVPT